MAKLNEAGLSAAEAYVMNMRHSRGTGISSQVAREILESYFEHAEVDTKKRLHPEGRHEHLEGWTHKFVVGNVEGYITTNSFPDGSPGEVFLHGIGKQGSTVMGLMDLVAILISVALQYGVPLKQITKFMIGMDFEPKGTTDNWTIPEASSLPDYIARYLEEQYGTSSHGD